MKRINRLIISGGLVLSSLSLLAMTPINKTDVEIKSPVYVDFFTNYQRETFTLSNGTTGIGNSLIYKTVILSKGGHLSKPEDPERNRYDFKGWYLEANCINEWDFFLGTVEKNTRLFAKWELSDTQGGESLEPPYTPPSTVLDDSASTDYVINSIMYFKVVEGALKLPTAALSKLEANKDNVLPLMEYKVKNGKTITATYANNKITVTCGENNEVIQVKDDSITYKLDNTNYEDKAKKYEAKALEEESYHVMLAGSSSIEFWNTSKEDLDPIVSYNHGIGGTTIEEWDTCLNQRLVFPYKPKMAVYYVGINNVINSKQDANTIYNNLYNFFEHTHAALPDTKIQYIMMNLIPGYKGYFNTINSVNQRVITYQESHPWLTLINPGTALLKPTGEPDASYFRTDGLHLSYYGYEIWGSIIKESIIKGLENN